MFIIYHEQHLKYIDRSRSARLGLGSSYLMQITLNSRVPHFAFIFLNWHFFSIREIMNSPVQVCREIKTSSLITLFTKRKCNHYICIRVVNQHRKGCYSEFIHRVHILLCGTKHSVYKNRVHIYLHCGNISIWQNILVTIDRITRCMLTYLLVNLKRKLTGIYLMIGVSGY